jgi:hypothetical protein
MLLCVFVESLIWCCVGPVDMSASVAERIRAVIVGNLLVTY